MTCREQKSKAEVSLLRAAGGSHRTGAVFNCKSATREEVEQRMSVFSNKRWIHIGCAERGVLFQESDDDPCGKLVEELGLKGTKSAARWFRLSMGNFITNDGSATARNVLDLIELVKAKAKAERGIELHTEVEIVGED